MQVQSALAVTERNETGLVGDEGVDAITYGDRTTAVAGEQASLDIKAFGEGMINFVKAGTGQGIELHAPNRPGMDWQSFHDRMTASCLQGIEWDPAFALPMNEPGGNWGRVKLQKVNRRIMKNGFIEARTRKSEDIWYLAWRIDNGLLRPPSDGDIFSWCYHLTIPTITGDSGNEEAARREAYKLGLTSLLRISAMDGGWWEDERKQREIELRNKYDMVLRLLSDYPTLKMSAQEISNDIEMKNPNGASTSQTDAMLSSLKLELDAYGTGVRAGVITPNDDDEEHYRTKFSLPGKNENVDRAWIDDEGVRRPITLVQKDAGRTPTSNTSNGNKEQTEDEKESD